MRIAFIVALVSASIFPAFAQTTATIPHFACGGGWSTTVMFTNGLWYPLSSSSNPWRLHFTIDVRSQDNRQLFSSVQSLSNSPETYTHTFTCDSDQIQTGRIDWTFYDSELAVFNQPQRKLRPLAIFSYNREGATMEAGMAAQFMSGVDTITGQDSKGNTTWLRVAPSFTYVPIVQVGGYRHGIAVSNPFNRVAQIQAVFVDQSGQVVYRKEIVLQPRATTAWTVTEVSDRFIGSVLIYDAETTGSYAVGMAIFRFSPDGQFTSLFSGY